MSRSYKKTPVCKDGGKRKKFYLRLAARKVRHAKFPISNGGAYKNLFDRYSICDWSFRQTLEEHLRGEKRIEMWLAVHCGRDPKPVDIAAETHAWRKYYRNK